MNGVPSATPPPSVMWFRRDLRLHDQPALHEAAAHGPVLALFVLDRALLGPSGAPRVAYLYRSLRSLDADLREHGGGLIVRHGKPENVLPELVREIGAASVHISADFGPYGAARDERVREALGDTPMVATGSPYAVAPGRVTKPDGEPYKVFTPFSKAWAAHGWRAPARTDLGAITWATAHSDGIPADPELPKGLELPEAGESAALAAWSAYRRATLADYADVRDRPDLDETSRMSHHLKYGELHPRTLLEDLGSGDQTYRTEIAWREFYATILHFWPRSAREYYLPALAAMKYDTGAMARDRLEAWKQGRTGYPIVDAGMRQLLGLGWIHNRVRMIVASFLVKDLHLEWTDGARYFMQHLVDGDLASNSHGWQWTAGTGTDAAPYFRIFNPVTQGRKFDPTGAYIRRWVPELAGLDHKTIHEPWTAGPDALTKLGYPPPIVDHARERQESLARYQAIRGN
jgi:deoxyribodipyrimidine photo-lyase